MNTKLIEAIKTRMNDKTDEELSEIWTKNDTGEWSEEAFEAIRLILTDRGITPTAQNVSPDVQRKVDATQLLKQLPAFPLKKAIRIERNFRAWSILLALWLFFGFFNMFANFSNVNNYSKAIQNLRNASSPSFSVKPEFAEIVKRASQHIDALETLQIYHVLVVAVSVVVWVSLFPIRKRFLNRQKDGAKFLLVALLVVLGVHTIGALLTISIPMEDVMGFVDIFRIRVLPFVMGLILLSLTPFFGKKAEIFYQYTTIDRECFKKNGVGIDVLKEKLG